MTNVVSGIFRPRSEADLAEAREAEEYRRMVAEFVNEMTKAGTLSGHEAAQWRQWDLSDDDVLALCLDRTLPPESIKQFLEGKLSKEEVVAMLKKNKTQSPA